MYICCIINNRKKSKKMTAIENIKNVFQALGFEHISDSAKSCSKYYRLSYYCSLRISNHYNWLNNWSQMELVNNMLILKYYDADVTIDINSENIADVCLQIINFLSIEKKRRDNV